MPSHQDIGMAAYYQVVKKQTAGPSSSSPTAAPFPQAIETVAPTTIYANSLTSNAGDVSGALWANSNVMVSSFIVLVTSLIFSI
mmetsp:Transcript_28613/g.42093  ORF Transcript_28613/g.42093 Transcript_28613/m.42093 type:complete len:84 (-) Transcript_28613:26-277(-)